jgi:type I restriction enzyme M protein
MPPRGRKSVEQQSADLKDTLWKAADKLRGSMDAAEYKHFVLGLIFLKYTSHPDRGGTGSRWHSRGQPRGSA